MPTGHLPIAFTPYYGRAIRAIRMQLVEARPMNSIAFRGSEKNKNKKNVAQNFTSVV